MKSTIKLLSTLLEGKVINCKTIMKELGYSNASREIIRKIEKPFDLRLKREPTSSKNRYGETVTYLNYSLNTKDKPKVKRILRKLTQ